MFDLYESDHGNDHAGHDAGTYGGTEYEPTVEAVDVDQDGAADGVVFTDESTGEALVLVDTDKDAAADLLGMDVDGDAQIDIQVARDGDEYVVWADKNHDGEVGRGEQATLTRAELEDLIPGAADLLDQNIDEITPADNSSDEPSGRPSGGSSGGSGGHSAGGVSGGIA
jgi:hypothetical protein